MEYTRAVAKTIFEQLRYKPMEVLAWGSKDFRPIEREFEGVKYPAIIFSIRTPKIRRGGRVIVSYNGGYDHYMVEAVRIIGGKENLIGSVDGVYVDQLHDVINSLIEDEDTYMRHL